jgi:hypothetical protein
MPLTNDNGGLDHGCMDDVGNGGEGWSVAHQSPGMLPTYLLCNHKFNHWYFNTVMLYNPFWINHSQSHNAAENQPAIWGLRYWSQVPGECKWPVSTLSSLKTSSVCPRFRSSWAKRYPASILSKLRFEWMPKKTTASKNYMNCTPIHACGIVFIDQTLMHQMHMHTFFGNTTILNRPPIEKNSVTVHSWSAKNKHMWASQYVQLNVQTNLANPSKLKARYQSHQPLV